MSKYTILNKAAISSIVQQYGFQNINTYKLLKGGSENTNYCIDTINTKFVLTICEQKTANETFILSNILKHLEKHNFVTSKIVDTVDGKTFGTYKGKPVLIKKFIQGKVLKELPNHLLELAGQQMGKLHTINAPNYLPNEISYGQNHFNEVTKYAPNSSFAIWLKDIKTYIAPYLKLNPVKSLIHSDLFPSNIIISDKEKNIIIMDFEEAAYYYRVFDVGMALVGLCCKEEKLVFKKAKYFLKGYQKEVKLTLLEKNVLQAFTVYAAAAMTFWRHKHFNYTKPLPELKNHYKELQNITNYIKDIPVIQFKTLIN